MTDLEKLRSLFKEFEIGFTEEDREGKVTITAYQGAKKIGGYMAFYTSFEFDPKGKFLEMGAWE